MSVCQCCVCQRVSFIGQCMSAFVFQCVGVCVYQYASLCVNLWVLCMSVSACVCQCVLV